jgi:hypothetical protein
MTAKKSRRARPATTPKPAPPFHNRRHELLAWMREDPSRALRYVAHAWFQCVKYEGKTDLAPMAEVLAALTEAEPKTLKERNGPRAWARRQPRVVALPTTQAEAGRSLVGWIEWWLKQREGGPPDELRRRRLLLDRRPMGEELSFVEWILCSIVANDALAAGWGEPRSRNIDEQEDSVIRELEKVTKRYRCNADHIALAVLVGWGMPRTKAKDALKRA